MSNADMKPQQTRTPDPSHTASKSSRSRRHPSSFLVPRHPPLVKIRGVGFGIGGYLLMRWPRPTPRTAAAATCRTPPRSRRRRRHIRGRLRAPRAASPTLRARSTACLPHESPSLSATRPTLLSRRAAAGLRCRCFGATCAGSLRGRRGSEVVRGSSW